MRNKIIAVVANNPLTAVSPSTHWETEIETLILRLPSISCPNEKVSLCQEIKNNLWNILSPNNRNKALTHSNEPIEHTLVSNVSNILMDVEIPVSIKLLSIRYLQDAKSVLVEMASHSQNLLLDSNNEPQFPKYEKIAQSLRKNLQRSGHIGGVTFTGRKLKLFSWTRTLIERTQNPLVGYILDNLSNDALREAAIRDFKKLNDISNLLVFHIACGDDVADNIQDSQLTQLFAQIPFMTTPELEANKKFIAEYHYGIYSDLFEFTHAIWKDSINQLSALLGESPFQGKHKDEFISIHQDVMGSLIYSYHMNEQPYDPDITLENISKMLDPNIMIKCVRHLEYLLVEKLGVEHDIPLPDSTDQRTLEKLISISQKNAAASNAAATAPRKLKEGDLSSTYPFEMNRLYNRLIQNDLTSSSQGEGSPFVTEFESFLTQKGYRNHFFLTYFDEVPTKFDLLELLMLRRDVTKLLAYRLEDAKSQGINISDDNYLPQSLGQQAIPLLESSKNENLQLMVKLFKKQIRDISLIDDFYDYTSRITNVHAHFFKNWETQIAEMRDLTQTIGNQTLRVHSEHYVNAMELFLVTRKLI